MNEVGVTTQPVSLRHSGFGITSFVIALVMGIAEFGLLVIAGVLEAALPGGIDERSPIAVALGLLILGGLLVSGIGIIFGLVGVLQKDRRKIFSNLGVTFNAVLIVGMLLIIVMGLKAQR